MLSLITEATIVGIITFVIGTVVFNLSMNQVNNKEKVNKPYGIDLAFFITGFILHILLDIVGLNQWYCAKIIKST